MKGLCCSLTHDLSSKVTDRGGAGRADL